MQVKKYIAQDMQEAVRMIKEEMGPRAVILSTRKVRKGSGAFGLFGKYVLEVTAAQDAKAAAFPKSVPRKAAPTPSLAAAQPLNVAPQAAPQAQVQAKPEGLSDYQWELQQNSPLTPRVLKKEEKTKSYGNLQDDISELKDLIHDLRKG
ncbi:MAG: hypothetical protein QNL04_08200, partial [SAR324 cluster bacterium]|nr:hypothetical protein [SAR324 cluster bacterium]